MLFNGQVTKLIHRIVGLPEKERLEKMGLYLLEFEVKIDLDDI